MLILLLLFAFIRALRGAPSSPPGECLDILVRNTQVQFSERGVNDIIISCFATIFACTWSAVHPNIPAPTDCWWTRFKRQVVTMIYALLAPEAMTAWALRQRLAARKIVDDYNQVIATAHTYTADVEPVNTKSYVLRTMRRLFKDFPIPPPLKMGEVPRWTLTHGFLLQMGGFILCEDGRPTQVLIHSGSVSPDEVSIIWNIQKGIIDAPAIPEEDIQDRSKGDAISKALIILQTTWFIVQCITRWSTRLPVTELEVVTLGFAMLNGITYALWWNKPQNIGRPICLPKKPQPRSTKPRFERKQPRKGSKKPGVEGHDLEAQRPEVQSAQPSQDLELTSLPSNLMNEKKERGDKSLRLEVIPKTHSRQKSWSHKNPQRDVKNHSSPLVLLKEILLWCAFALIRPLVKLAEYGEKEIIHYDDIRVPMFFSGHAGDSEVFIPTAEIGALFGSVHLISSWFLQFSSAEEKWLWRVSAILITIGPIILGLWRYFYFSQWANVLKRCTVIGVPLYIISRVILLISSLISLQNLTPAALQTVEWTTFIPHL